MINKKRLLLIIVLTVVATGLILILPGHSSFWGRWSWENEALHSAMEAIGFLITLSMSLLLFQRKNEENGGMYFFMALGFLSLSLFMGFVSVINEGRGFVLLHSVARFVGGFLFALVWLPGLGARISGRKRLPIGMVITIIVFSLWAILFRNTLPLTMRIDGQFTTTALIINYSAAIFFMLATLRFLIEFYRSGNKEFYIFATLTILLGLSGFEFSLAPPWCDQWWLWHIFRLAGFIVAFFFLVNIQKLLFINLGISEKKQLLTRAALQEEQLLIQSIVKASPLAICFIISGKVKIINQKFTELSGYYIEELIGDDLRIVSSDGGEYERIKIKIRIFCKEQGSGTLETNLRNKDGKLIPVQVSFAAIDCEDLNKGIVLEILDITLQKEAEYALKERELHYRSMFENTPVPFQSLDKDGRILEVNKVWLTKMGYKLDKVIGSLFADYLTADHKEIFSKRFGKFIQEGKVKNAEFDLITKSGAQVTFVYGGLTVCNEQGEFLHTHCIAYDITERKSMEEKLKKTEEQLRFSINEAAIGIVTVTPQGQFLSTNKYFRKMVGYKETELRKFNFQSITHPDDYLVGSDIVKSLLEGKINKGYIEKRYLHKSGTIIWVNIAVVLIRNDKDEPLYFFSQISDITENKTYETELRVSEERFRLFFKNVPGAIFITNLGGDNAGQILDVNPAAEIQTGYSRDELLKMNIINDLSAESFDEFSIRFRENKLIHEEPLQFTEKKYKKDGSAYWADVLVSSLSIGNILMAMSVSRDITDKIKADQDLKASEHYYRAMLSQLHEDVLVIEKDYTISDINNSFLQTYGHVRENVIGKTCYEVSHGYDKPCDQYGEDCPLIEVFRTGQPRNALHEHNQEDGSKKWLDMLFSPLKDEDGNITKVVESVRDVSEMLEAQNEIRKLWAAIRQSPVSILLTDKEGTIEYVNPQFCKITGYTLEESVGQNPRFLKTDYHPLAYYKDLWDTVTSGKVWQGEFQNIKKDGELFWEDATIGPVLNEAGEITNFIGLKEDITERKSLQEQLNQSQKLESIGQLAGGVAHDFNNLLTVINGYSALLMDKLDENDPMQKDIQQIAKAGERAGGLTQQLLAFSRKQVIKPRILNLNKLVTETEKMLGRLIGENIDLKTKLADDLYHIKADPGQMDQIIMNLAVNARDAMHEGGHLIVETQNITIDKGFCDKHLEANPGDYALISVSDSGTGMNDETKKHIFEPFFTTKEKGRGTGLGLATVYGIVKQNGGYIWVYSEEGVGTTFKIYLPRVDVQEQDTGKKDDSPKLMKGSETILFVEDEIDVLNMVSDILSEAGYKVLQASNGREAITVAGEYKEPIHLLVSDVIMPEMGGKKLAEQLRKDVPELKVIFVSGYTDEAISKSGILDEGMILLQKPFASWALLSIIRETLDDKK